MFKYDSPIMTALGKLADLVILNLLTILFCIPIVTIGAAVTAAQYTALKLRRGEGYVFSNFWKSFKVNFVQSTIIGFLLVVFVGITAFALMILGQMSGTMSSISMGILFATLIFVAFMAVWIFPLQSKFVNKIGATIRNSFIMSFKHILRTLGMLLSSAIPVVLVLVLPYKWWSILFMVGLSVPAYLCAMLYDKPFEKIEELIMERERGEEEGADSESTIEEAIDGGSITGEGTIEEVAENDNSIEETPSV